jgi:hypothetical protein
VKHQPLSVFYSGFRTIMASMKYVWKIIVRNAPDDSEGHQGYAYAGSMGEALELANKSRMPSQFLNQGKTGRGQRV